MRGWILCRLRDEDDYSFGDPTQAAIFAGERSQSLSRRVYDVCYGTLSVRDFPPAQGWVFLAKGKRLANFCILCVILASLVSFV
jgi:hypothetical protein